MLTLWDLLPKRKRPERVAPQSVVEPKPLAHAPVRERPQQPRPQSERVAPMQDRYDAMTRSMLQEYKLRVRKWRTSMSGIAWQITYRDGSVARLVEAPRPKGPMSAAVFLHEVGHHAIGFNRYKPRCLEEYHAWAWALAAMERHGLNITDSVHQRMASSLQYAIDKARRRGLRELPPELVPFDRRSR